MSAVPEVGHVIEFDHGLPDLLRMRITDLTPDESVEWKCVSDFSDRMNPASEWLGTRLSFDLRTAKRDHVGALLESLVTGDEVTILQFRQTGWAADSRWFAFCNCAWGETLGANLKRYCEAAG